MSLVDRGVSLNGAVDDRGLAGLHRAAERADHSCSKRALKAERISDRQYGLADLQAVGIAHGQSGKVSVLRVDLDECDVVAFVGADKFRVVMRAVSQGD